MNLQLALDLSSKGRLPTGDTDWYYRNLVPKTPYRNLKFREVALKLAYEGYADELWKVCSRDILFYINSFGWTLNPKEYADQPLRPFITWEYQDKAIQELCQAIGNHDLSVPKTRDMGASWMCLLSLEHRWHFRPLQMFLLTSEKEELVDGKSPKALFKKLDFWWDHLPVWLRPNMDRFSKHCTNRDNGSVFSGEATVQNMATGDRCTAMLLDEMSKMPNADKILTSTRDVTKCRLFNSTPNGRFGTGAPFFQRVRNPGTKKMFLHWTQHPEKSKGMYREEGGNKVPLGKSYDWTKDYSFQTLQFKEGKKPRSPWYDDQVARAQSSKEIAQELDIDFLGSAERFAEEGILMKCRDRDCCDPFQTGMLIVGEETLDDTYWQKQNGGPLALWCWLDEQGNPPPGDYVVGVDVSQGAGGEFSSESAICVWNSTLGEQVAMFASPHIRPFPLATLSVAICNWFHEAFLVPEANGPGATYMRRLKELNYWNLYRRKQKDVMGDKVLAKYGYINNDAGAEVLSSLQEAIAEDRAIIRDPAIVEQFLEYEFSNGKLVHAGSFHSESQADKGRLHGDRAIAAACGWLGVIDRPVIHMTPDTHGVPYNAFLVRQDEHDRKLAAAVTDDFDW